MVAAPFAAWLVRHLPATVLGVAAGGVIVITNSNTLLDSLGVSGTALGAVAASLAIAWLISLTVAVRDHRAEKQRLADEVDALDGGARGHHPTR